MQASIALGQSLEELLQTAFARLNTEIKAETNPKRLERLLSLAFKARLPRAAAQSKSQPTPTSPTPSRGERDHSSTPTSTPTPAIPVSSHHAPALPQTSAPPPGVSQGAMRNTSPALVTSPTTDEDEAAETEDDYPPLSFTHMTEDEFTRLERQIGFHEANRRRLIRAHLANKHPAPTSL